MAAVAKGRVPRTPRGVGRAVSQYFQSCAQGERQPTVTGLALALGFSGREELRRLLAQEGDSPLGSLLARACSQVEEENLQAVYRRDTSSGAKFILQSCFGYGEKELPDLGPITVQVEGEEG